MKNGILVLLLSGFLLLKCAAQQEQQKPVPVIFDTDIGNDIDDVLALQMLLNYEKQKKINLLGITISKNNPRVIEYIDAYCRVHQRGNMPLGFAYNGVNPEPGTYVPRTLDTLVNGKKILHPRRTIQDQIPEGYKLHRKLLAAQPDQSVVMIVVGPQTNMARLLQSAPDEYSNLPGVELVKRKVRLVSVMGGVYSGEYNFSEWNIVQDLKAAQTLFSQCPVPLIASGFEIGDKLRYPATSILSDFKDGEKNPLVISYKVYEKMPYDRPTWDLTSVLYAVEPGKNYFKLSPLGRITIAPDGKSHFSPTSGEAGLHRYLISNKNEPEVLDALVRTVTGKP